MKANYNRHTQPETTRISNILALAIKNHGIISKSTLIDCMLGLLDKSADKKVWKMLLEYSLSAPMYADQIFAVRKVSDTYCQITRLTNPDTLETVFEI